MTNCDRHRVVVERQHQAQVYDILIPRTYTQVDHSAGLRDMRRARQHFVLTLAHTNVNLILMLQGGPCSGTSAFVYSCVSSMSCNAFDMVTGIQSPRQSAVPRAS